MPRRIALLISILPLDDPTSGLLRVANVETSQALVLPKQRFVLTLEHESEIPGSRGQLRLLPDGGTFPIQSNQALFEALLRLSTATE